MNASGNRLFRLQHMPFALVFIAAALVLFFAPAVIIAQESNMPDLRGVWKTRYATPTEEGRLVREGSYEVTRQDGELFWGVDVWHPIDPKTGKALDEWIRIPFAGSLDGSGESGLFATKGVRFAFRLTGPDEAELEMTSFKKLGGFSPHGILRSAEKGRRRLRHTDRVAGSFRLMARSMPGSVSGRCETEQPPPGPRSTGRRAALDGRRLEPGRPSHGCDRSEDRAARADAGFPQSGRDRRRAGQGRRTHRVPAPVQGSHGGGVHPYRRGQEEPATAFHAVLGRGGEEPLAPAAEGVNLVGTWTGEYRYALPDRPADAASSLVITRQEGNAVWAEDVWTQPGEKGADPVRHRDPMAGGLSPDGTHGALAKPGACFTFRVADADHLEFDFTRVGADGNPAAFQGVFTRKK